MFKTYIQEIKEKPFIISFLILSIISCVAYSYNFFPTLALDDEFYQSGIFPYMSTDYWDEAIHKRVRFPGLFIGTILSDGTMAKSMTLFLTLISSSLLSMLFIRKGLKVQSIFWSVVFAIPIIINASIQVHYFFVIALLRFTVTFFILALFLSLFVQNKLKNIIVTSLLLFVCLGVYELSIFHYIVGVILLVIVSVIEQQQQPLIDNLKQVFKNKILPSIMALGLALVWRNIWIKIFFTGTDFKTNIIYNLLTKPIKLQELKQQLRLLKEQLLYAYYPASHHNLNLIFGLLLLVAIFSCFWLFRKQKNILNKVALPSLIVGLLVITVIVINAILSSYYALRVFVINGLFISILLYLAYLLLKDIKILKHVNLILSCIFVIQMSNSVVHHGYTQYMANEERRYTFTRLYNDVLNFAPNLKGKEKATVYFIKPLIRPAQQAVMQRGGAGITFNYAWVYNQYKFQGVEYYMKNLGVINELKLPDNDPETIATVTKNCQTVVNDKNMSKWPFANSMKSIDGVVYVKLTDDPKLCGWLFNKQHQSLWKLDEYYKISVRNGYYDLSN